MSFAALERAGLGFRLNAWYAGVFTIMFVLAILAARLAATEAVDRQQDALIERELSQHRLRIEGQGLRGLSSFVAERRRLSGLRWFVRVTDATGHTLVYDAPSTDVQFDDDAIAPSESHRTVMSRGHERDQPWQLVSTKVTDALWLQVGFDDEPRRALLARIEKSLWTLLASGLLVGLFGGHFVTRRALAPIRQLSETCQTIVDSSDVSLRVPMRQRTGGQDELGGLALLFNRVLDRNERLVTGMRQALDNVAHDLRTPLSRLRSGAELALHGEASSPALREALADCIEESDRVVSVLHTLMDISEAESGVMRLRLEPVLLSRIVAETVDLYQHVADQRGVTIRLETLRDARVMVDRQRMVRALANLLDNALKYTDAPGEVCIKVDGGGAHARMLIADSGVGIAREDLSKIWQRLYRADPSRSRQGLGLGLSLVKAIVEANGGTVDATSELGKGSTFAIELPFAPSA